MSEVSQRGEGRVACLRQVVLLMMLTGLLAACATTPALPPVTTEQILQMSREGVPAADIIQKMRDAGTVYRLSGSQLFPMTNHFALSRNTSPRTPGTLPLFEIQLPIGMRTSPNSPSDDCQSYVNPGQNMRTANAATNTTPGARIQKIGPRGEITELHGVADHAAVAAPEWNADPAASHDQVAQPLGN